MRQKMRVGSLFTGIGGLDLGLSRASFEIAWQVEIDPFCFRLLGQHWPEVQKHRDVRECGAHNLEHVDLIVGGFPCQDISTAGKQAGIEGERSGLWREQARIIAELRPCYVLIENVAALLYSNKRYDGMRREAAINTVLRDLAALGYDAEWRLCSAAEFGAPHLRKRVFIVAYLPRKRGRAWRAEPARQPGQTDTDSGSAANVEDNTGRGQQEWADTTGPHRELDASGPQVADTNGDRQRQWAREPEPGVWSAGAANTGENGECRDVANASRGEGRRREQRGIPTDAGPGGTTLADTSRKGCATGGNAGRIEPPAETLIHDAEHGGEVLADPCRARLEERNGRGPEQARTRATTDEYRSGKVESRMGGIFDGFPYRLDGIEHRWPAGPGQEQYEWEPARVIQGKLKDRVARLKGLGNAALPQIAEAIGYGIRRHAAQQGLEVEEC